MAYRMRRSFVLVEFGLLVFVPQGSFLFPVPATSFCQSGYKEILD